MGTRYRKIGRIKEFKRVPREWDSIPSKHVAKKIEALDLRKARTKLLSLIRDKGVTHDRS
jgi:hypothetical protein